MAPPKEYSRQRGVPEAEALEALAYAGRVEVLDSGTWRPFIPVTRPLGRGWDSVCVHNGKPGINTYPELPHVLEFMQHGHSTEWRRLLDEYKAHPTGPVQNEYRIIPEQTFN